MERLQKYMARCGVASRRKSEELILDGVVEVNGEKISELGYKVNPETDVVKVKGKVIKIEEVKHYIMLNKPKGIITSVKDEKGRRTVIDLIQVKERIYPIGRLDYDTSGILLLTNDGDVYNNIMHPRKEVNKVYMAKVKGKLTEKEIKSFCNGIDIGGYITADAKLEVINFDGTNSEIKITIHEGKNRQIRRMCEAINHPVMELKRISIGEIKLGNLKLGNWRELSEKELKYIKEL